MHLVLIRSACVAACLSLLLPSCETPVPTREDASPRAPAALDMGENLRNEECELVSTAPEPDWPASTDPFTIAEAYGIHCNGRDEASAHVQRLSGYAGSLADIVENSAWREHLETFAKCETNKTTILDDLPAIALSCRLVNGGWKYRALAARLPNGVYLVDGIPAVYLTSQRAIGLLGGLAPARIDAAMSAERATKLRKELADEVYGPEQWAEYLKMLRLAQEYNYRGEFRKAQGEYQKIRNQQLHKKLPSEPGGLAFILMHIALELSNQGRFDDAERVFSEAEDQVAGSFEPTDAARLDSYRALHLSNMGEREEAALLAEAATSKRRGLAGAVPDDMLSEIPPAAGLRDGPDAAFLAPGLPRPRGDTARGDLVQSLTIEAAMHIRAGEDQFADATRKLENANGILDDEPGVHRRWAPQIRFLQAEVAEREGRLEEAEYLLLQGLDLQKGVFERSRAEGLAELALGRIYIKMDRQGAALGAYRQGFDILAQHGGGMRTADLMPYLRLAHELAEEAEPTQAAELRKDMFEAAQLARHPVVAETITLAAARVLETEGDETQADIIRQYQDAQRLRDRLDVQITLVEARPAAVTGPALQALQKEWLEVMSQIDSLETKMLDTNSDYNHFLTSPVESEAVQGLLEQDEALIQILVGPEGSFGFLIERGGLTPYPIDLTRAEAVRIVDGTGKDRFYSLRYALEDESHEFPESQAHHLYQRIFGPIADEVRLKDHLIIVADGPLASLPFAVLTTSERVSPKTDWLVERHALTYAPSVRSFLHLRKTRKQRAATGPLGTDPDFIGFGAFEWHGNTDVLIEAHALPEPCDTSMQTIAKAPPLNFTLREVAEIKEEVFPSSEPPYFGRAFTEQRLKGLLDEGGHDVVFIATHAFLPSETQCLAEPALMTSRLGGPANAANDGLLSASEIVDLDLEAQVVVLSACSTAGAAGVDGESLSGLAQAFFYAGAGSLLVSHWAVDDENTAQLMIRTFSAMSRSGLSLSHALRAAQMSMADGLHPYFWAAFTPVGDGGWSPRDRQIAFGE